MPTLIRLIITLLFRVAGLVYAGMFALVAFVEPTPKEVTIRIPAARAAQRNSGQRPIARDTEPGPAAARDGLPATMRPARRPTSAYLIDLSSK